MKAAQKWIVIILLGVLILTLGAPTGTKALGTYDDLTANEVSFVGRRGATYTMAWDPASYTFTFSTPDNSFPWDWFSFVGQAGSVAINGKPEVGKTLSQSDAATLTGAMPGDLMRIKGAGVLGLTHLTKIGLVLGSGSTAQRAWFSSGVIDQYFMSPEAAGYRVQLLGRTATVRISSLKPQNLTSVALIEVSLDDPSNASLILATDFEPVMDYSSTVEWHNRTDTQVKFQAASQALLATQGTSSNPVYFYSDQPLASWSGNNLTFDQYLAADQLDGLTATGNSDGRSALRIAAQPVQRFYLGTMVLDSATRSDPSPALEALRSYRLGALQQMPVIDSLNLPRYKLVNAFSNLIHVYLLNPSGGLYYTDKAFVYLADVLMPAIATPHLMPEAILTAMKEGLTKISGQQFGTTGVGSYGYKVDTRAITSIPSWYAGNFPDIIHWKPDGGRYTREVYSDIYPTAEFINAVAGVYRATGDQAFVQSLMPNVDNAVMGLKAFDLNYDIKWGQDGNLLPNILVPMSDLGKIAGEYPGETAQMVYALQDAAYLYRVLGRTADADALQAGFIDPLRAEYDARFWNQAASFYQPVADANSSVRANGTTYNDFWVHTIFVPLRGDLGRNHLAEMLAVLEGPTFTEPGDNIHWLSKNSENFVTVGRWNLSKLFTNGWGMEGGFLTLPNAILPIGYFQMEQSSSAEGSANRFLDKYLQYGPHELMNEWSGEIPGKFGESSLYIEPASASTWMLEEAMGMKVNGLEVTLTPRLSGAFVARNLRISSLGQVAVLDYARDAQGQEWINIQSNTGLTITAPHANGGVPPTATPESVDTATLLPPTATFTATVPQPTPTVQDQTSSPTATVPAATAFPPTATDTPLLPTATATAAPPVPTATDTPTVPTATATATLAPSSGGDLLYLSSTTNGVVGGLTFSDEDILTYDTASGQWAMYFDGSDLGLGGIDVDAFTFLPDGSLIMSFDVLTNISGLGTVYPQDIVQFIPTATGQNTAGTFSLYFDGSDVAMTATSENIDAIGFAPDGRLVISAIGGVAVPGVATVDEDLLAFAPTQLGQDTAGTWSLYFLGYKVKLNTTADEDVNGIFIAPDGKITMTTVGAFSVDGLSGDGSDLFVCNPLSLGENTACTFSSYWIGSEHGFLGQDTDGIYIVKGSGGVDPTPTATSTPTATATAAPPTATATAAPPTFTPTPTQTPDPTSNQDWLYLSASSSGIVGTVAYEDEDILRFDPVAHTWEMFLDGSDIGLGASEVTDFEFLSDGSLILSLGVPVSVPQVGWVTMSDILKFTPTSTGDSTEGNWSMYFDGSDVGLDGKNEYVDAVALTADGRLIISTNGPIDVPGFVGADEDLAVFAPTQLGWTTAGTWALYLDGSVVGLNNSGDEEINGAWIDPNNGKITLTTLGAFSVNGSAGDGSDLFNCTPLGLGNNSACTFGPGLYWDGSAFGFSGKDTDGVAIVRSPNAPPPPPVCLNPTRIMPLGASYTQGYASTNLNGYRRSLYLSLTNAGYGVDFVGSAADGLNDFDRQHEGHPGWSAKGGTGGGIAPNVYNWLVANPAHVVLLHIGTNDISSGGQSAAEVAEILDEIDRHDPNTWVVLALIINRKTYSPETTQFNLDVKAMAEARIANGDKIVIVDMEHALIYPDDMADETHPNDVGYQKTAVVWFNALKGIIPTCR